MLTDPQYSEERLKFIEELQSNNKKIFNLILAANKKRENASFVMEKLFPASVLSNINELSNFPNADSPNLFNFNNVTKKFEEKYIFITLKRCGKHLLEYSSVASVTGKSNGLCDLTVLRFPIASAPETVHRPEQQFRNAFLKTREVEYSDRMITIEYSCNFCARLLEAVDTKSIYKDAGLIAVVITVGNGTVSDDVYHDPRTYKVVLDFTGRLELDSFHYKPISIHVTGYFIKRRLYP